jgi:putative heme-binding domain-containing protein
VLVGIKTDQGPSTFTLRQPGGIAKVWSMECVRSMETQPWSLMPEGLEQGMDTQDMADLLEYITTAP